MTYGRSRAPRTRQEAAAAEKPPPKLGKKEQAIARATPTPARRSAS
jgi:hypothetical protein